MRLAFLLFVVGLFVFVEVECFFPRTRFSKPRKFPISGDGDPGKPLFLTPYIEAGEIKKAQRLSKVNPEIGNSPSYSGFFTTDKKCGNNIFFWFFLAQENWEGAPIVLWLQGGPGASSIFGLFEEVGPFNSYPDGLKKRDYSWNVKNNLLIIDQPVGTGFSFTKNGCYPTNQTTVGNDLYSAIIQFLKLFPNLQKNKFVITGESFAGHYIPAIGYTIYKNNPSAELKINLAGMMIGDGWTDPREQIVYGDYLYQVGLIDRNQLEQFHYFEGLFKRQVDAQMWDDAYGTWDNLLDRFEEYAGVSVYNYLPQPADESNYVEFVTSASTRKAIHVGSLEYDDESDEVYNALKRNLPQSMKPWVEELLENYPMVFYFGQVDVICGYPMGINFLRTLKWSGQDQYLNAARRKWFEGEEIAGYVKGEYHLYDVLVRDAGHMVPADQPFWAYQLVNTFTSGNFSSLSSKTPT